MLADVRAQYAKDRSEAPAPADRAADGDEVPFDDLGPSVEEAAEARTAVEASVDEASSPRVAPVLARELAELHEKLGSNGAFPTRSEITRMVGLFRERFGPEVLAGLDGLPLLQRMHARGTKDSLVHWIEFKEDEELTASTFGSIAGGSALKFGVYQSVEAGAWMTGTALEQQRLERDEAVTLARRQRDEPPDWNPQGRRAPQPRPDFAVRAPDRPIILLDAKYRDLWARPLPREMLYQLAMYATSGAGDPLAVILHPAADAGAEEARVDIRDVVTGAGRGGVALRPVPLERLAELVREGTPEAREAEAQRMAFGGAR